MATPDQPPPRRRRRLGCQVTLLVFLALAIGVLGVAYVLWSSKPAHWKRNQEFLASQDNETLLRMATTLEQRIIAAVSDPNSNGETSEERVVPMTTDEVNAWLYLKLGTLLTNQNMSMPPEVSEPMIAANDQRLVLAFRYQTDRVDQIVSSEFKLTIQPDGMATVKIDGASAGNLPVPLSIATSGISRKHKPNQAASPKGTRDLVESLMSGYSFDPTWEIDHARQVRLIGYRLTPQGIEADIRSEPRPPKSSSKTPAP